MINYNKGQVEMIGLVIVVILIVFGALFYVKFLMITEVNEGDRLSPIDSIKANNLMGAVANLQVCGGNYTIGEMISMVGTGNGCGDKSAEEYLQEFIPPVFEELEIGNYRFWVMENQQEVFGIGECVYGLESGSYVLIVDNRYFKTHLKFCAESSTEQ